MLRTIKKLPREMVMSILETALVDRSFFSLYGGVCMRRALLITFMYVPWRWQN
jgi:hypothetical protein